MSTNFKRELEHFAMQMHESAMKFSVNYPEVLKFWQDGFLRYISKMKEPKNIKHNPRRYFHLHAIRYILRNCNPSIVWNLCPGNLRTILPVLQEFIDNAANSTRKIFWINIDLVPEIKILNDEIIKEKWTNAKITSDNLLQCIQINNVCVMNLIGTIEDFFPFYEKHILSAQFQDQVLICLDGIANAIIQPEHWISWWNDLKELLSNNFKGWYLTWLNSGTLDTKFEFYYKVALKKHKHPLNYIESTTVLLSKDDSSGIKAELQEKGLHPLSKDFMSKYKLDNFNQIGNFIFRFFTSREKTELVYQTFYLNESGLKTLALLQNDNLNQFVGHREVDTVLFSFSTEIYDGKEENFVKSIPYLGIQRK